MPHGTVTHAGLGRPEDTIRVSARIRPFTPNEVEKRAYNCLRSTRSNVTVVDPNRDGKATEGAFDEVFDSFDSTAPDYASQEHVYNRVGRPLLDLALQGYHATLLGYGQTGSGKTHTLMGDNMDRGVVPRFITDLFLHIKENPSDGWEVFFEAIEIYEEKIYNLLEGVVTEDLDTDEGVGSPTAGNQSTTSVRSERSGAPKRSKAKRMQAIEKMRAGSTKYRIVGGDAARFGDFAISGLTPIKISDVNKVFKLLGVAEEMRTIAEHQLNVQSSRAHTLFRLTLKRKVGREIIKPVISLVDLAGSENVKQTGVEGEHLKEAIHINKSLSVLAHCLNLRSKGKKAQANPPYTDSVLTKILKKTLKGNAQCNLVVTLSPSQLHAGSSARTIRFGQMCKRVATKAIISVEDEKAAVRELKQLNQELKGKLERKEVVEEELKMKIAELTEYVSELERIEEMQRGPQHAQLKKFLTQQEENLLRFEEAYFQEMKEEKFKLDQKEVDRATEYYRRKAGESGEEARRNPDFGPGGPGYILEEIDPDEAEVWDVLTDVFQWSCTVHASDFLLRRLKLEVQKLERVINPGLREKFYDCKSRLHAPHYPSVLRFFGDQVGNMDSVLSEGFSLPDPHQFSPHGVGVLFSGNATKAALSTSDDYNQLLVCEVALGKLLPADRVAQHHDLTPAWVEGKKVDSVYANRGTSLINDEYIVFNRYQAVPVFVITYKVTGPEDADAKRVENLSRIRSALEEQVTEQEATIHSLQMQLAAATKGGPGVGVGMGVGVGGQAFGPDSSRGTQASHTTDTSTGPMGVSVGVGAGGPPAARREFGTGTDPMPQPPTPAPARKKKKKAHCAIM